MIASSIIHDIKIYLKIIFFKLERTKSFFFDIISNWKWLSVEIGYMALLVAFDIPSEFDVLLAACGWCRAAVPPHSTLSLKIVNNDFKPPLWKETEFKILYTLNWRYSVDKCGKRPRLAVSSRCPQLPRNKLQTYFFSKHRIWLYFIVCFVSFW